MFHYPMRETMQEGNDWWCVQRHGGRHDNPTAARIVARAFLSSATPRGMALVCATCRFPVPDDGTRYCDAGEACPHRVAESGSKDA